MKTSVRVFDSNDTGYDLVVNEENPYVPAIGDEVSYSLGIGKIVSRRFIYVALDKGTKLLVELRARMIDEPARNVQVRFPL